MSTLPRVTIELPAMEWALDTVANHSTPYSQMCTQVRAVCIYYMSSAILTSKYC